jgi:hypothetical protein
VAQLNSALDYGSRGYWFESSQGHKTPIDIGVFLCFIVKKTIKINRANFGSIQKPVGKQKFLHLSIRRSYVTVTPIAPL